MVEDVNDDQEMGENIINGPGACQVIYRAYDGIQQPALFNLTNVRPQILKHIANLARLKGIIKCRLDGSLKAAPW
jgi:hypothetical protein